MADQQDMGIGFIGQATTNIKRKFRYTFSISGFCNNENNVIPESTVKTAGRPNLTIEETALNYLNGRTWLPGKSSWETITVTYIDVAHETMQPLWNWLATLYDFTDPVALKQGSKIDWDATGVLNMYDGCGTLLETWELQHMFPTSVNFGDLDYGVSDEVNIELTLRYSDVIYKSYCPEFTPESCCTGCGAS